MRTGKRHYRRVAEGWGILGLLVAGTVLGHFFIGTWTI